MIDGEKVGEVQQSGKRLELIDRWVESTEVGELQGGEAAVRMEMSRAVHHW